MEPVPHLHSIAINRQLHPRHRVANHERNQFLWKLIPPIIIGTPRDENRQPIRSAISPLTKRWRSFTIPDRFSRLPAYVSLSRLTTRQSPLAQRSRTKLLPIKPQPPVTNTVFI